MKKKILCLIPARAGSKGIKNKNLVLLKGKPLLYWTIKLAKGIKYFDKIIVSTDSNKIQRYALKQGVDCPFLRPKIISGSKTPMLEVFNHTLQYLSDSNYNPYAVVLLQPTSPMRTAVTINKACKMFLKKKTRFIIFCRKDKTHLSPTICFQK